jgi:Holliday junction resolvase RusA-like endonuclease
MSLPPGINNSYKIVKILNSEDGVSSMRLGATPELEEFKESAGWELKVAPVCDWLVIEAIKLNKKSKTPLAVRLKFYFPTLWKRDIDGGEKHVIDAAFRHLGLNDTLVLDLHVTKEADREDPRCEIEICCLVGR